jgi:putative membrane protein
MWGNYGSMMGWGWGSGWGLLGAVHMLLWWALIILGIVVLVKWLFAGSRGGSRAAGGQALEILKERYARGEIGKEEFEQKKRDLGA